MDNNLPVLSGKDIIQNFAMALVDSVKEGRVNPLDLRIQMAGLEKAIEMIKDNIKSEALTEFNKHGKSATLNGFRIDTAELGTKYNYAGCGDTVWSRYNSEVEDAVERRSNREKMLKTLTEPITVADDFTGEIITIHPPVKSSTTGLKFTAI